MKVPLLDVVFIIIMFVLGGLAGYTISQYYQQEDYYYEGKQYDGFHFTGIDEENMVDYLEENEPVGNWVCVNIKGMTIDRAYEVCRHEVGHEIFAEYCQESESNLDKCAEVLDEET